MALLLEPFYIKMDPISQVASNGLIIYTDIWKLFGVCQDNCKIAAITEEG